MDDSTDPSANELVSGSGLFTPWRDPFSGVESWVLAPEMGRRVAPFQQSFYFTNPGFSRNERFLWFYCAFPPSGDHNYGRTLAVADLREGGIRHFPETQFLDASPAVHPSTGDVYWTTGTQVWKRGPHPDQSACLVGEFPASLVNGRRPHRLATHLTFSADGSSVALDAQIGADWFLGELPLDGSPFRLWQQFDRCYNHTQFSPTCPDLMLTAQDQWQDPRTGEKGELEDRIWLIRRGETVRPLFPDAPSRLRGHEWWDTDGRHVWYVDYEHGTEKANIETGERTLIWPGGTWHSYVSRDGRYLVGDRWLNGDMQVVFFNADTGREVNIVTAMPPTPVPMGSYHLHPHPQFCADDRVICYTTMVRGTVDVAVIAVDDLIDAARQNPDLRRRREAK
jgi:hypothetical protein